MYFGFSIGFCPKVTLKNPGTAASRFPLGASFVQSFTSVQVNNFVTLFRGSKKLIVIDSEIVGGKLVFKGTRVPVETLFDHLEAGVPLEEFLEDFPTVTKEQAITTLDVANKLP